MYPRDNSQLEIPGLAAYSDAMSHLVAVEATGDHSVLIYRRHSDQSTSVSRLPFQPWLLTSERSSSLARLTVDENYLTGTGELNVRKRFTSGALLHDAVRELRANSADHLVFLSRTEQFLVESGWALFQGMDFEDMRRAQIDIETMGLNPADPENAIIIISATINGDNPFLAHAGEDSEPQLIERLSTWIRQMNPDVIEGHNIFNFDLPFLAARAARHGVELRWGRDGSPVRFGNRQRFKAGARTIPFDSAYIRGRHIIDTYQQIQRYDVAGHLSSYALKPAIAQLGLERTSRTHVAGEQISEIWKSDPDRLLRYAIDDVLDTNLLSELTLPTEFYQAQLLPASLQSVATGGPGEKVNDLLVRAYLRANRSIPLPRPSSGYPGGFTAVRATGIFGPPVVNADVESLYPSIMLSEQIAPASDEMGVFLPILSALTSERLRAKRIASESDGAAGARWQGTQSSLKVLINSFYGYLGYSRGYFNDFNAAAQVTRRGHAVIQEVESILEEAGSSIVEIDTDGIYFVPPEGSGGLHEINNLVDTVSARVGEGIRLSVDGVWQKMLSLKLKNYALVSADGQLTVKGSSLRSRRDEPYLRDFLIGAIKGYLSPGEQRSPGELYIAAARRIIAGKVDPEEIGRHESVTDRTFTSESNRRLARAVQGERVGERVAIYQRQDGSLERIENYANDEDRAYLLQRLRSMAERFRPLYTNDVDFDHTFPKLTPGSDIDAILAQERATQQSLFDI